MSSPRGNPVFPVRARSLCRNPSATLSSGSESRVLFLPRSSSLYRVFPRCRGSPQGRSVVCAFFTTTLAVQRPELFPRPSLPRLDLRILLSQNGDVFSRPGLEVLSSSAAFFFPKSFFFSLFLLVDERFPLKPGAPSVSNLTYFLPHSSFVVFLLRRNSFFDGSRWHRVPGPLSFQTFPFL